MEIKEALNKLGKKKRDLEQDKEQQAPEEKLIDGLKALGHLKDPRQEKLFRDQWKAGEKHAKNRFSKRRK